MNVKSVLIGCLSVCLWTGNAQADGLKGFAYAAETAPIGNEWDSPENLALNKEQPRAWFFSFQDVESARKVLPETSFLLAFPAVRKYSWRKTSQLAKQARFPSASLMPTWA